MFDRSLIRRFVAVGAAVAVIAFAAPLAAADPAPLFIPQTQHAFPRLGEGLTGADRSWLAPTSGGGQVAVPSTGFHWGDAGIGAATAATVLGILGGAIAIRRRPSPAQ
jgi:hypothetical protein